MLYSSLPLNSLASVSATSAHASGAPSHSTPSAVVHSLRNSLTLSCSIFLSLFLYSTTCLSSGSKMTGSANTASSSIKYMFTYARTSRSTFVECRLHLQITSTHEMFMCERILKTCNRVCV